MRRLALLFTLALAAFAQSGLLTRLKRIPEPAMQQSAGITDHEAQLLKGIADDWQSALNAISTQERSFVFEARLAAINSGEPSTWLPGRLQQMADRRAQLASARTRMV